MKKMLFVMVMSLAVCACSSLTQAERAERDAKTALAVELRQPLDGRSEATSGKRRSPEAKRSGWWRSQPPNPDRRESEAMGENKGGR